MFPPEWGKRNENGYILLDRPQDFAEKNSPMIGVIGIRAQVRTIVHT